MPCEANPHSRSSSVGRLVMSSADHYRAEALRCLRRAEEISDPDMKRGWLSLAMEYEPLAKVLEERQKQKDF